MRILPAQLEAFQKPSIRRVAEQWLPRLRSHFPARLAGLSDDQDRASIEEGIERGLGYGLTTDAELYRFVIARLSLGDHFDEDPALPWAQELLLDRDQPAGPRMDALVTLAIAHLDGAPL